MARVRVSWSVLIPASRKYQTVSEVGNLLEKLQVGNLLLVYSEKKQLKFNLRRILEIKKYKSLYTVRTETGVYEVETMPDENNVVYLDSYRKLKTRDIFS